MTDLGTASRTNAKLKEGRYGRRLQLRGINQALSAERIFKSLKRVPKSCFSIAWLAQGPS